MAKLTEEQRQTCSNTVQTELSRRGIEIPVGANGVDFLIDAVDDGLETAEASIITGLPNGVGKTWLQEHVEIGREIMAHVAIRRKELL